MTRKHQVVGNPHAELPRGDVRPATVLFTSDHGLRGNRHTASATGVAMAESRLRKWTIGLQPVQGGEILRLAFEASAEPSLEDAASLALARLPTEIVVTTPVPQGDLAPNQTALKGRGYEIVSMDEVLP